MKAKIKNLCVFSILFFAGCAGRTSSTIKSDEISNIIDLTAGFKNIQTIRLSEFVDSVTFIPLETTRESLLSDNIESYQFSSRYIFRYDQYFDWNGKYCITIGKGGNGPFEEPEGRVYSSFFSDNHFYSKGTKFIEYDITGKPTGKVRNLYTHREFNAGDIQGVEFFNVGENFALYDFPITLRFFNKNFETVSSRVVTKVDSLPAGYQSPLGGFNKFATYYKDHVLFYNFLNDTVFYVTDTGLYPHWIVSFDDPSRLPTQVILQYNRLRNEAMALVRSGSSVENSEIVRLTDNKHIVRAAYETESYLFFLMTEFVFWADRGNVSVRNKKPADPYIIYYEKNNGKTTRVKGKGFVDDLLGMDFFYPQLGIFDEKLISIIWPFELLDFIGECRDKGREVNPQLLALSKQVKEEDNPIIILAHLKKK